jgi:protein-disulfide isomerase
LRTGPTEILDGSMRRRIPMVIATFFMALALPNGIPAGFAQSADEFEAVRRQIEELKQGQAAIHDQLKTIQELLRRGGGAQGRRPAATVEPVDLVLRGVDDDPSKGDGEAELMLIEYTDYQCPFCRRHATTTLPQLEREYLSTGKVRYVLRDFPLETIHPSAFNAARAAGCASEQGKHWEMHDRLFEAQGALAPEDLRRYGEEIGLDAAAFAECLESDRYTDRIRQEMADASAAGVSATPTFFLAVPGDEPGTAKALARIRGAQPYPVFKGAIDAALAKQNRARPPGD